MMSENDYEIVCAAARDWAGEMVGRSHTDAVILKSERILEAVTKIEQADEIRELNHAIDDRDATISDLQKEVDAEQDRCEREEKYWSERETAFVETFEAACREIKAHLDDIERGLYTVQEVYDFVTDVQMQVERTMDA